MVSLLLLLLLLLLLRASSLPQHKIHYTPPPSRPPSPVNVMTGSHHLPTPRALAGVNYRQQQRHNSSSRDRTGS